MIVFVTMVHVTFFTCCSVTKVDYYLSSYATNDFIECMLRKCNICLGHKNCFMKGILNSSSFCVSSVYADAGLADDPNQLHASVFVFSCSVAILTCKCVCFPTCQLDSMNDWHSVI